MSATEQRAWEREQKRLRDEAGEEQAAELNEQLSDYVDALEELVDHTLRYPVSVDFQAMKVAVPQFQPGNLAHPIPEPRADDFKPKPPGGLATLVPGAEKRFRTKWERGRATFEQAHARWQHDEQQRRQQLARAEAEHRQASESAEEQHRRIDELEADFRTGKRAAIEQCLATALQSSVYPSGFPHEFMLIYRSREHELLIEYEFPLARDVIPEQASYRYVKTKGLVESKARTATDTQKLYKSVLAQLTLRTLYELFTADRYQHVQRIAFNGVVDDLDPATGRPTRPKLVSVRVSREEFLDRTSSTFNRSLHCRACGPTSPRRRPS